MGKGPYIDRPSLEIILGQLYTRLNSHAVSLIRKINWMIYRKLWNRHV